MGCVAADCDYFFLSNHSHPRLLLLSDHSCVGLDPAWQVVIQNVLSGRDFDLCHHTCHQELNDVSFLPKEEGNDVVNNSNCSENTDRSPRYLGMLLDDFVKLCTSPLDELLADKLNHKEAQIVKSHPLPPHFFIMPDRRSTSRCVGAADGDSISCEGWC